MTSRLVLSLAVACLSVVAACGGNNADATKVYPMRSGAMEPLLPSGKTFEAVEVASYEASRGDVVVFRNPDDWLDGAGPGMVVARVLAVPGDHLVCCAEDGRQVLNGQPLNEPYLRRGTTPSLIRFDVTVPEGHVWVEGDNRPDSADSRVHLGDPSGGFVPVQNVEAIVKRG